MSDKQFPPSIKRLNRARKEGKIVKSRMVSSAVSWWACFLVILYCLTWVRNGTLIQWVGERFWSPELAITKALWLGFSVSLLIVGVLASAGLAVGLFQTKLLFSPTLLLKGFQQYQPGAWFGKIKDSCTDTALGLVRGLIIALTLLPVFLKLLKLSPSSFEGITSAALDEIISMVKSVCIRGGSALFVIAGVAYLLARWKFYKQHRMSMQELKDEYKEDEGDPHVKSHRKMEHRAMLFAEVEKRVKRSKVVVVRRMNI